MSIDGFEWDAPDTKENAAAFGYSGASAGGGERPAFPKVRVVTVSECASHAVADAELGGVAGKGAGEQALARRLYKRLDEDWLLIADRNFYNWAGWCTAAGSGAALLWRVKADLRLPASAELPGAQGLKGPLGCLTEARFGIVCGVVGSARDALAATLQGEIAGSLACDNWVARDD